MAVRFHRRNYAFFMIVLICSLIAVSCSVLPDSRDDPGEAAFASAGGLVRSPESLIEKYSNLPVEQVYAYQILERELLLEFRQDGSLTRRINMLVRILSTAAVERFSILNAEWQPWRQSRPVLIARVIGPGGTVSVLDPASIVELGSDSGDINLRTDARMLSAPVPKLEVGSILEYQLEETTTELRQGAGIGGAFRLGDIVPTERTTVRIVHPADQPVTYAIRGGLKPERRLDESDGIRETVLSFGRQPAYYAEEDLMPYDEASIPFLRYGSSKSWQSAAAVYWEATEPLLEPASVAAWANSVVGAIDTPQDARAAALALTDTVRSSIRYTGILFGENSIIPHEPSDTLALGYGDCKDQAALLAASLRSVGIEAYLSLLKSGFYTDSDPAVPGLDSFDHVIVYAPGLGLWIDPTATYAPPGELPAADQRRLALVISPNTQGLIEIPGGERPWQREVQDIQLSSGGLASRVIELTTAGGTAQQALRATWGRVTRENALSWLREYGDKVHKSTGSIADMGAPGDLASPFFLKVSTPNSELGWTDDTRAFFTLRAGSLFDPLPSILKPGSGKASKRNNDVWVANVPVSELVYRVSAPPGHRLAYLPEAQAIDLGPARISSSFEQTDPSTLLATFRLEFMEERFGLQDFEKYLAEMQKFLNARAPVAVFENIGRSLMDEGKLKDALAHFRALEERFPEDPIYRLQSAAALRQAGFLEDAVLEAERAVALAPENPRAHHILALMLVYDPFGKQFGAGANLSRAAEALLAAQRLNSEDKSYFFDRALILEYGTDGVRWGDGARLEEALEIYRSERASLEEMERSDEYLRLLFHLGRYDEILTFSRTLKEPRSGGRYLLAALAAKEGTASALARANTVWMDMAERRAALGETSLVLLSARFYAQSSELLLASARGTPNFASVSEFSRILSAIRPSEPLSKLEIRSSPAAMIKELIRAMILEERLPIELLSARLQSEADEAIFDNFRVSLNGLKEGLRNLELSPEALVDLIIALLEVKSAKLGEVVFATMGVPAFGLDQGGDFVMVQEPEGLAFHGLEGSPDMGSLIWKLFEAGKAVEAGQLLDAVITPSSVLPSFTTMPSRTSMLLIRPGSREARDMAVSCAALGGWEGDKALAATFVQPCFGALEAEPQGERRRALLSLVLQLSAKAGDAAVLEKALRLAEAYPGNAADLAVLANGLRNRGMLDQASRILQAARLRYPSNIDLIRMQAKLAGEQGRVEEYYSLFEKLIATGAGITEDYNNYAWGSLFLDGIDLKTLQGPGFIRRLEEGGSASAHTAACFLAAAGRFEEALSSFVKLLGMRDEIDDTSMWTAHGFLALSFGLEDRAILSFRKAAAGEGSPIDSAALARVMLKRLERE
jgi:Flp pilus assembly protein TadD